MGKRLTLLQAEALGLVEKDEPKPRKKKIPQPPSKGEEVLALHLKANKIQFRREYQFYPSRGWKLDFAILGVKLAIEVEGAVEKIGRHQRPEGFIADIYKYNTLIIEGWRLLRFTTKMVMNGEAIKMILEAIKNIS